MRTFGTTFEVFLNSTCVGANILVDNREKCQHFLFVTAAFFGESSIQQRSTRVGFLIVNMMTMINIYERMERQIPTPPKPSMSQLGLTTKAAQLSEIANPAQLIVEDFFSTVLDRRPPTHGG